MYLAFWSSEMTQRWQMSWTADQYAKWLPASYKVPRFSCHHTRLFHLTVSMFERKIKFFIKIVLPNSVAQQLCQEKWRIVKIPRHTGVEFKREGCNWIKADRFSSPHETANRVLSPASQLPLNKAGPGQSSTASEKKRRDWGRKYSTKGVVFPGLVPGNWRPSQ